MITVAAPFMRSTTHDPARTDGTAVAYTSTPSATTRPPTKWSCISVLRLWHAIGQNDGWGLANRHGSGGGAIVDIFTMDITIVLCCNIVFVRSIPT